MSGTPLPSATTVTSAPVRTTFAVPNGIVSDSGAGPLTEYRRLCSRKMTGLSSRIEALSSPFASAGEDGKTIFRPGTPWNHVAWICEWIAPKRPPAPTTDLITIGTLMRSSVRNQYFVAWLMRLSIERARKSPNMISSTGRIPVTAAP